jgi:hypothetical protein
MLTKPHARDLLTQEARCNPTLIAAVVLADVTDRARLDDAQANTFIIVLKITAETLPKHQAIPMTTLPRFPIHEWRRRGPRMLQYIVQQTKEREIVPRAATCNPRAGSSREISSHLLLRYCFGLTGCIGCGDPDFSSWPAIHNHDCIRLGDRRCSRWNRTDSYKVENMLFSNPNQRLIMTVWTAGQVLCLQVKRYK